MNNISPVKFNMLKQHIALIPLSCAKQYLDGAWQTKESMIYQDGTWTNIWGGELFEPNNTYDSITGGWSKYLGTVSGSSGSGSAEIDKNLGMVLSAKYNSGNNAYESGFRSNNPINLSGFNTLRATMNISNDIQVVKFRICEKKVGNLDSNTSYIATHDISSAPNGVIELQIPLNNVTKKNAYIVASIIVGAHNDKTGAATISKIWLE